MGKIEQKTGRIKERFRRVARHAKVFRCMHMGKDVKGIQL